jgi:hypothetical protein
MQLVLMEMMISSYAVVSLPVLLTCRTCCMNRFNDIIDVKCLG